MKGSLRFVSSLVISLSSISRSGRLFSNTLLMTCLIRASPWSMICSKVDHAISISACQYSVKCLDVFDLSALKDGAIV